MRVLIVEDEFLIASELELLIAGLGYDVLGPAATFAAALSLAEKHAPDVATIDLRLKDGDSGEALAERLLNELAIRPVFVSGNLDDFTRARLQALRPYGFLGKPLSLHSLAAVLSEVDQAIKGGG